VIFVDTNVPLYLVGADETMKARAEAIQPEFDAIQEVVDEVFPIGPTIVERAKSFVLGHRTLSARDAIHAAVTISCRASRVSTEPPDGD
jgi:predicted nucleic acid-binding protein